MPNIIEQQDLLKGLPDARLAMLLQNPVADIPPFLVAAEAQRRQALRQQFSGDANKESVVDSLTKQLAKVPQNIQAPAQIPPVVPPTPQMQGVAALQAQQAVQQAAQQAVQPQAMAGGGMVRRYQEGGYIRPTVDDLASSITGKSREQYLREQQILAAPPGSRARFLLENKATPKTEAQLAEEEFRAATEGPLSGFYTPESVYEAAQKMKDIRAAEQAAEDVVKIPGGLIDYGIAGVPGGAGRTGKPLAQRSVEAGKEGTSPENKGEPQPLAGETQDEYRARLEALYASQEPSNWEKAQRWFAMAEQFLDPSKTTMQSIAGAGQAFAESASEQARAQREMDLAREKAMLEYDMQIAERDRAAKVAERERTTLSANEYANVLIKSRDSLSDLITSKRKQLAELESNPMASDEAKEALKSDLITNEKQFEAISGQLAALGISAYGEVPYDVFSLSGGFKR